MFMKTPQNTMTVYEFINALLPGEKIFGEINGFRYVDVGRIMSCCQDCGLGITDPNLVDALIQGLLIDDQYLHYCKDELLLSENEWQRFQQYKIKMDEEVRKYDTDVRRPYYQMRGKKISERQAMEVR